MAVEAFTWIKVTVVNNSPLGVDDKILNNAFNTYKQNGYAFHSY